ncbi:SIS domain-containing protein [Streptomyces sp. DT2A-34]|uniref:D-sedoheptulose-7-phosphate isomerase n=1 Tax=Streptomyces sp. DT2A-34 TaxID=3051182 RepID=UPI00265BEF68|nr:SIS domain-containing protein [Streptomyces sp. DT2A-34]MDO0912057.1 SIS domain-containing protein [Streptomyces sp. DT2A-34]
MDSTHQRTAHMYGYLTGIRRAVDELSLTELLGVAELLEEVYLSGRTVFTCGNGGSAATASHFAVDLAKNTRRPGAAPMRVYSLVDHVPAITAWANDVGYESVFSGQLSGLAEEGDVLVGITTSGNSPNVLEALRLARELGVRTVGLLGPVADKAVALSDRYVKARVGSIEEQEDIHMMIAHILTRHMRDFVTARPTEPALTAGRVR